MNRCAGQERSGRGWYRRDQREQATAADRNCDGDRVAIGDLTRLAAAQAVTTYRWRRAAAHTTLLERGSPSGVTKLITAKAVFSSTRQIRSVVRLRADAIVILRPRASPNTSTTLSSAHIPAHLRRPYSEAVPRLAGPLARRRESGYRPVGGQNVELDRCDAPSGVDGLSSCPSRP